MRPENSTRKVNTILKCQEINDIVLSSYGSVGEGDKCLALFTPVPPYLWSFPLSPWLSLSPCLFLIYSPSNIFLFLPPAPPSPLFHSPVNSTHTEHWRSGWWAVPLHRERPSASEKRRSKSLVFVRRHRDPNMWTFPSVKTRNFSLFSGPSNCILLLSSWREEKHRNAPLHFGRWGFLFFFFFPVFCPSLAQTLTPPIPLQRPGMGSRF